MRWTPVWGGGGWGWGVGGVGGGVGGCGGVGGGCGGVGWGGGVVLPMWWVIHMCRGFDPLFSLWQDRARSFWGVFSHPPTQKRSFGYKSSQNSIFLAPKDHFPSIFLGPIFSGPRHTPSNFRTEYPPPPPAEITLGTLMTSAAADVISHNGRKIGRFKPRWFCKKKCLDQPENFHSDSS